MKFNRDNCLDASCCVFEPDFELLLFPWPRHRFSRFRSRSREEFIRHVLIHPLLKGVLDFGSVPSSGFLLVRWLRRSGAQLLACLLTRPLIAYEILLLCRTTANGKTGDAIARFVLSSDIFFVSFFAAQTPRHRSDRGGLATTTSRQASTSR